MAKYSRINKALDSGLLKSALCEVVEPPQRDEIEAISTRLPFALSRDHAELLAEWGGSSLDEIRILSAKEVSEVSEMILFAADYNGYQFAYGKDGEVFAVDTDGDAVTRLSSSVSEFINRFFLGEDGVEFYGKEWLEELRAHGLA